jgi:hypothetical protein
MNKYQRRQIGIKKARKVLRVLRAYNPRHRDFYRDGGEYEHRLIKTRVPCSCPMCGNPRRHFKKLTRQEEIITTSDNAVTYWYVWSVPEAGGRGTL